MDDGMWQTIETAPKDGTDFLCFDHDECSIGYFSDHLECFITNPLSCMDDGGGNKYAQGCGPKYWMPLPKAPKDK